MKGKNYRNQTKIVTVQGNVNNVGKNPSRMLNVLMYVALHMDLTETVMKVYANSRFVYYHLVWMMKHRTRNS